MSVDASARMPRYFAFSDGLRALAIFFVYLAHLAIAGPLLFHHLGVAAPVTIFDGVVMLFVLSGYLLSGPFITSVMSDDRGFPLVGGYAFARFLRIYPLYLTAVVALTLLAVLQSRTPTAYDIFSHVALIQDLSASTTQSISGPLWTMAVDAQFYIILPLVFFLLYKTTRTRDRPQRVRALVFGVAGIVALSVVYRLIAAELFFPKTFEAGIVVMRQLPGMLCVFACGIAARAFVEVAPEEWKATVRRLAAPLFILVLALQPVYLFVLQLRLHELTIDRRHLTAALWSLEDLVAATACGLLVVVLSSAPAHPVTKVLSSRFFAWAASLSYAFYLFHLAVVDYCIGPAGHVGFGRVAIGFVESLLILVPLCYVLHRFVEQPFLLMKSKLRRSAK